MNLRYGADFGRSRLVHIEMWTEMSTIITTITTTKIISD